jgi:hypothetical protein
MNGLTVLNEIEDRLAWTQTKTLNIEPLSGDTRKLLRLLNRVLQTITGMQDWPLLRKEGTINLLPAETSDETTGSEEYVTATLNSDVVTVANATFDLTYKGRAFQVAGDNVVYRIKDVTSPTTLQLNHIWVSDSITVSDERTYIIAMDQYALPTDFDRPITDMQGFFAPYNILPLNPDRFSELRRIERGLTRGEPRRYTLYGMNDGQTSLLVHFHPYPEYQRVIQFPYQIIHPEINTDNDKILFPNRYIAVIEEMVLQLALRDYEDDSKTERVLADMLRTYNQQVANPDVSGSRLRIRKSNRIRRSIQRSFGVGGWRINWGDWFDKSNFHGLDR